MLVEDIFSDLPELQTDRLKLRKLTMNDIEDIFTYASDDEVSKYVTWDSHRTLIDTKSYLNFVLGQYEKHQLAPWGIELKENPGIIGTIDFVSWQPKHNRAEIGYVLAPSLWGIGLMTEASQALIKFGFEKMDLIRIQARTLLDNKGSQRVLEKSGMIFEGVLRKEIFIKGKHHDVRMFSIIKEEWEKYKL
ncbi:GNAT family N-acetyltransferase [Peribacillus alkalitolerans]|uniref:GNAT family N-acetyltransferase n=1 Tax=Peribacillus alkalitolerans TaxID=1550385 RepID=UPI0013D41629|nr:GNAT family protein [Peribacillus alkalitolerans]